MNDRICAEKGRYVHLSRSKGMGRKHATVVGKIAEQKSDCPTSIFDAARQLRKCPTATEEIMWQCLRNRRLEGARFRRQHVLGPYIVDFYCREAGLVIECDGGYHLDTVQQATDRERDLELISAGMTVLRFWNDEIMNDTENVLERIAQAIRQKRRG